MNRVFFEIGFLNLLTRLWYHLSRRRHIQFQLLVVLMLVSAIAEVVSLGAVLPFLGVLITPERVLSFPIIANLAGVLGIKSADQLVLPLTLAFALTALIAGLIRILLLWVSTRIAFATGADLGIKVYRHTLYQPYKVHAARNSSEVISGIIVKVNGVAGVLLASMTLVSSTVLLLAIVFALLVINPLVASIAAVGFGASYALISLMTRRRLNDNGRRIAFEQTQVVKALQEGLGGIRDVLLDGSQLVYCEIFGKADQSLRRAEANNIFIGQSPRFAMEAIGMVLIASLAYGLSQQPEGIAAAVPVLGALALGAQRLLPALQQIFSAWATIVGNKASLIDAIDLLDQPMPDDQFQHEEKSVSFEKNIRFDAVRFRYTSDSPWVLDDFNLTIPKGSRVGFFGSTGSGKSTALDILMGLLTPTEGAVLLDGHSIGGSLIRSWQGNIAHVPQSIYLADATLSENIAFGERPENIDFDRVRQAAHQAQIANFIESNSDGYNALVGERGVRLSGGQRQRIGIARALYKQASVLVFDEATSALDNETEISVMEAIEGLGGNLTILIIAHRLTTLRQCNIIVELDEGRVIASGTYKQLIENSSSFRSKAKVI